MPFAEHAAQMIREKLDTGELPGDVHPQMFAGYGDGQACDGCELPISAAKVEWEFITPQGLTLRFHLGCAGGGADGSRPPRPPRAGGALGRSSGESAYP